MPDGFYLTPELMEQVQRTVRETVRRERGVPRKFGQHGGRRDRFHWGVLTEDMDAATNALNDPATACVQLLKRDHTTGNLETVDKFYTVTNRFEFVDLEESTIVKFEFLDGEWSLYAGDCGRTGLAYTSGGCT